MEEKKNKKASFKEYNYKQTEMFPSNMSEWIAENHLECVPKLSFLMT